MSRRDVLVKGTLVAGAAWTAPMLMSTRAYAFGVSSCPSTNVCGPANELQFCCPKPVTGAGDLNFQCFKNTDGSYGCAAPTEPGGICVGNNGAGTSSCKEGVFCNGNASSNDCTCNQPNTCGGYGSSCTVGSTAKQCSPGFVCTGSGFCAPSCTGTGAGTCPTTLLNKGTFTCQNNVCRQSCSKSTDCSNGRTCTSGTCV